MKFSRRRASSSLPSSSIGRFGSAADSAAAKRPAAFSADGARASTSAYTFTRSMPQLGDFDLSTKPDSSSRASAATRAAANRRMRAVQSAPVLSPTIRGPGPRTIGDQPDALARHAHPDLDLRADRHPFDQWAQLVDEECVALVLPVKTDLRPEQARRNAQPDPGQRLFPRGLHGENLIQPGFAGDQLRFKRVTASPAPARPAPPARPRASGCRRAPPARPPTPWRSAARSAPPG